MVGPQDAQIDISLYERGTKKGHPYETYGPELNISRMYQVYRAKLTAWT